MTDRKLIALDIDGTTIARGEPLSDQNRYWIQAANKNGVNVTFATGRHRLGMVSEYVRELGITVPIVTLNGGEVWTADGELLFRRAIDSKYMPILHELALKYDVHYWGATSQKSMNRESFPNDPDFAADTWIKFGYYTEKLDVLAEIWAALEEVGEFSLTNSDPYNVEVNAQGATKAAGLQKVVEYLGIQPEEVVVLGDSLNDISMFKWAGLAVAMENAQESVKQVAHQVTASCEQNGVAKTIQQVLSAR